MLLDKRRVLRSLYPIMPRTQSQSIQNLAPQSEQSEPHQFHFNVTEINAVHEQMTTDVGVPSSTIDLQQQDLTTDQLQELFNRASSELVAESTNEQEFFKREETMKAPKTGQIIQTPFPPPPLSAEDRKKLRMSILNI